jgi:uncharacterized membrane protein
VEKMRGFVLFLLIVFAASVMAEKVELRRTLIDDFAKPGEMVPVLVSVRNADDTEADDVQVRLESPDYGLLAVSQVQDIDEGESGSFWLMVEIPREASGDMPFSIVIKSDDDSRRYYRWISVR